MWKFLYPITLVSDYLPLFFYLIAFRKLNRVKAFRYMGILVILLVIANFYSSSLSSQGINNMHLFHIYTVLEHSLITLIFIEIIKKKGFKTIALSGLFIFYLLVITDIIFLEPLNTFNSNIRSVQGVITLLYCVFFYYSIFDDAKVVELSNYPYFWLVSGMILYFSGTLFLYVFGDQIVSNKKYVNYYQIHNFFNIIQNTFYAYTLWLGSKQIQLTL